MQIWEDKDNIAILDLFPTMQGQTVLITKAHKQSDLSDMSTDEYTNLFVATKQVVNILKKGLSIKRVAMVVEGMGINHAHVKLYPLAGLERTFQEMWHKERIFFEEYKGYISTQLGPRANIAELEDLAKKLRSSQLQNS